MNHEHPPKTDASPDPATQPPMPNAGLNPFAQGCLGFIGFQVFCFILFVIELLFVLNVRRGTVDKIALPFAIGWGIAGLFLAWAITKRKRWWPFFPVGILLGLVLVLLILGYCDAHPADFR